MPFTYQIYVIFINKGMVPKRKQGLLSPPPVPPMYGGGHGHGMPPGPAVQQPAMYRPPASSGCVLMVYGLDKDRMNCDRLFNLLCCYGNILKVMMIHYHICIAPL